MSFCTSCTKLFLAPFPPFLTYRLHYKRYPLRTVDIICCQTQKEMIVLCYGTNNCDQRSSKESYPNTYQNIKKFITINNYTNILVINIPVWYDVQNNEVTNKNISKLNGKLQKLVKINPHTKFLVTPNDKNLYTKHGLHYNRKGKYLNNLQIASLLLSTFAHQTKKPIELDWHDQNSEIQSNIVINEPKIGNSNSGRNRKIPVTRTDDFYGHSKFPRDN